MSTETPTTPTVPSVLLNDGHSIPQVGLGVWQVPSEQIGATVATALDAGYRHIDTAKVYENEAAVGDALAAADVARDDVFVTTKVWNADQGRDATLAAFDASMQRLRLDVLDLYLIHWPCPAADRYVDTWKALVELRESGRVRSIGVCNFDPDHLERIIDATGVVPAVNQVELSPYVQQQSLRELHGRLGIVTEDWSPLSAGKGLIEDPVITGIAHDLGVTPAQVVLRWHLQIGSVVMPKSVTPERIRANIDLFGFALDNDQMDRIGALDRGDDGRNGPLPATFEAGLDD